MVSRAQRGGRRAGSCSSTEPQSSWAQDPVPWATSPTTVSDPLRLRLEIMRSSMGERSWASSTQMWP